MLIKYMKLWFGYRRTAHQCPLSRFHFLYTYKVIQQAFPGKIVFCRLLADSADINRMELLNVDGEKFNPSKWGDSIFMMENQPPNK